MYNSCRCCILVVLFLPPRHNIIMAIIKDGDVLFTKVKGSLGKQVTIYQRNGQTIMAAKRGKSTKKPTQKQLDVRWKMKVASAYARKILQDPEVKAYYKSMAGPGQNAYNMAVKDAYHSPAIQDIKVVEENTVVVTAKNEFRVDNVVVNVYDEQGALIETGRAMPKGVGNDWHYKATTLPAKGRIKVAAEDLPGNVTDKELLLEEEKGPGETTP